MKKIKSIIKENGGKYHLNENLWLVRFEELVLALEQHFLSLLPEDEKLIIFIPSDIEDKFIKRCGEPHTGSSTCPGCNWTQKEFDKHNNDIKETRKQEINTFSLRMECNKEIIVRNQLLTTIKQNLKGRG